MLPGLINMMVGLAAEGPNITQTDSRNTASVAGSNSTFTACSIGAFHETRLVVVMAIHGDFGAPPGTPTCTVGGTGMTRLTFDSTGDSGGGSDAVGTAIFVGTPTGTSGDVVVAWSGACTSVIVLRLVGYTTTGVGVASEAGTSTNGSVLFAITQDDAIVHVGASGQSSSTMSITGVTQRGEDSSGGGANNRRVWGFDALMTANAGLTITTSPWSAAQGSNSMSTARFHLA